MSTGQSSLHRTSPDDGALGPGVCKQRLESRIARQQPVPPQVRILIDRRAGFPVEEHSGAHQAAIESQDVHPALFEQMVYRGPVLSVRRRPVGSTVGTDLLETGHADKVSEQQGRRGSQRLTRLDRQVSAQKATRAGGIDHQARLHFEPFGALCPRDDKPSGNRSNPVQLDLLERLDTALPRQIEVETVHLGAKPVTVGNEVVRARRDQQSILVPGLGGERLSRLVSVEA